MKIKSIFILFFKVKIVMPRGIFREMSGNFEPSEMWQPCVEKLEV